MSIIHNENVKSIFDVLSEGMLVFAEDTTATLITLNSSGLKWWYHYDTDRNEYFLADELHCHNDMKRVTLQAARKIAEDWFEEAMKDFSREIESSSFRETISEESEAPTEELSQEEVSVSAISSLPPEPEPKKTSKNATTSKIIPKVVPPFLNLINKVENHSAQCCNIHQYCKYGEKSCSVLKSCKKQNLICPCEDN